MVAKKGDGGLNHHQLRHLHRSDSSSSSSSSSRDRGGVQQQQLSGSGSVYTLRYKHFFELFFCCVFQKYTLFKFLSPVLSENVFSEIFQVSVLGGARAKNWEA